MRRAGLPIDALDQEQMTIAVGQHFDVWHAIVAEAKRPDLPVFLGKTNAHGPLNVAVYAFSCSPNMESGADRLSVFKPLVGPISITPQIDNDKFSISIGCSVPMLELPPGLAMFELCYFVELVRVLTSEPIVPIAVEVTGMIEDQTAVEEHLGVKPQLSNQTKLVFDRKDAQRPFISANAELWTGFQKTLTAKLLERDSETSMSARVKKALLAMLPSGQSSVEAVCSQLHVSKRSLQRRLKEEGQTFQSILDATRSELSMQYLAQDNISVEEISHLLAFRDPNSFYRAFRGWTGMTPMEARGLQTH